MGQTWSEIARSLADSLIIPFKVQDYADKLDNLVKQLDADFGDLMRRNGIQFGKLSFFIIYFVHIFDMYEFLTMIFFLHRITSQRFTSFHIRDGCVSKICGLCRQERVCLYFKELKNTRSQIYQILIFCVITEQNNFCQSYLQSICNSENQRPASTTGASVHRSPRSTGAPPSQVHV